MFTGTTWNWEVFRGCGSSSPSFVHECASRPWTNIGKMTAPSGIKGREGGGGGAEGEVEGYSFSRQCGQLTLEK